MISHVQISCTALAAFIFALLTQGADKGQIVGTIESPSGTALSRVWVMTSSGKVTQSDADGAFTLAGLSEGGYALKAIAPGMADSFLPGIAVTSGVTVTCRLKMRPAEEASAVVAGHITDAATGNKIAAWLEIVTGSAPVRWFDTAGRPYGGRTDVPPQIWHQKNRRYWTAGDFAFSAMPGDLRIKAQAHGYAPADVTRALRAGTQEGLDIALSPLFNPAAEGWFKGDFHAHGVHGEKLYDVNIPFITFVLRAEGYRWFYLSSGFNNDGVAVDNASIAAAENGTDLFLALNSEYPKTAGGHIGNMGIPPPRKPKPYPNFSNTETVKADITDQGGAAVPLHPLYGHMRSKELPFLLLGAPELVCGIDFYTSWNAASEKTWGLFLNKGYRLCRTATSDAAFDLGRTPGTAGATYIHPAGGRLNREAIVDAFLNGRTVIAWDGALLLFSVDGAVCGETFPSGNTSRKAALTLYATPGINALVRVTRNGETFKQIPVTIPESGTCTASFELVERDKAWYTATGSLIGRTERVIAATSPFYFGDWQTPAPIPARLEVHTFDADTHQPLDAEIHLIDSGKIHASFTVKGGGLRLDARTFHRVRANAAGYQEAETGILCTPAIAAFISSLSELDLQSWSTYEKAADLLKDVTIEFPLKRK